MESKITINVGGMSCAACSAAVEKALNRLKGVSSATVNIATNKAVVVYDTEILRVADIKTAIAKAGFKPLDDDNANNKINKPVEKNNMLYRLIIASVFGSLLLYIAMGHMIGLPLPKFLNPDINPQVFSITQLILTIPILIAGGDFFVKGFTLLFRGSPNMDTLIAIGSTSSFLYSLYAAIKIFSGDTSLVHSMYFESAGLIIAFVLIGKTIEKNSKIKTSQAVFKLMEMSPKTAILVKNNIEFTVPVDEIITGDTVKILPGMSIPVDCKVKKGTTSVDESMLTGESIPIEKSKEDILYSGTINKNGSVTATALNSAKDSSLQKIIELIEDAQNSKAPIARMADKISGVFVPAVLGIAVLSFVIWLIVGQSFTFALKIFVSVLVIACPCSLGLATPTAIIAATGNAVQKGILIKSGEALEILNKTDVVVFDKTGTITKGESAVTEVITDELSEDEIIALAAAAEKGSEHPLSEAILSYADSIMADDLDCDSTVTIPGKGIEAKYDGKKILVGNNKFMTENVIDVLKFKDAYNRLYEQANTVVFVAYDGTAVGIIAISDTVNSTAAEVVNELKRLKIETVMLTGDNENTASVIAKSVGIDRVISDVLPSDKADVIKELKADKKTVTMVGDGINDAPALTVADIGISVKHGTDIAISSSDIVLMNEDLSTVKKAIDLSCKTIKIIKENLFWALIYNSICIPVAAGVLYAFGGFLLNPMIAALAMSFSSVSVVLNSLRLRK